MSALAAAGLIVGMGGFAAGPFDFSLEPGALAAVIGPNGAGKTSLLKTLAGLLPPVSGEVVPAPGRSRAAYLPPPGTIAADFTVDHLVALARAGRRGWSPVLAPGDYDAARSALEESGVAHLAARPFAELSSGQQQLVLLARLLVQDAPICLLDEPTALLDPGQRDRVDQAIGRLAASGRTVVVSTHRLDFAAGAALVVAVGGIVRAAPPDRILVPETLAALYGANVSICPDCGHESVVSTRA